MNDDRIAALEARLSAIETRLGISAPPPASAASAPVQGAAPPESPRAPGLPRLSESALGGVWTGRAGMAVLLTGLLFLAKFSWDAGWLGPAARVLSILGISVALLTAGEAAIRRPAMLRYGVLLTGGGICAAFFGTWAAHRMFALIDFPAAAAGYLAATAAGLLLSTRYDRQSPAFLGLVGGIATPLLLSTGTPRTLELFAYLATLCAASLWAALPRGWRPTLAGTLLGALFLYFGWWDSLHGGGGDTFALLAAATFLLLALVFNVLAAVRESGDGPWRALFGFGTLALSWALALALEHGDWTVSAALPPAGLALILLGAARLCAPGSGSSRRRYASLALMAALLVPLTQVAGRRFALVLGVETLALAFAAAKTGDRLLGRAARAAMLWAIAGAAAFLPWQDTPFDPWRLLFNERFATGAAVAACAFLSAGRLPRDHAIGSDRGYDLDALRAAGYALFVATLSFEAHDLATRLLRFDRPAFAAGVAVTIVWTLCALSTVAAGFWKQRPDARWAGLALFAASVLKVFLFDLGQVGAIYRVVSFLALGAVLLLVAWGYNRLGGIRPPE